MKVYWSSVEFKYDNPDSKLLGGFVYAFVNAPNSDAALDAIIKKLKDEDMTPLKVEFTKQYNLTTQWENAKQTKHYKDLYVYAASSKDVVLDNLYAYEK